MAKTWAQGSLRFTQAGDSVDSTFRCKTIVVRPSNTSWVVIIKDRDGGKIKFEASGADNRGDSFDVSDIMFIGATLDTATNLTSVSFCGTDHIYNAAVALVG